MRKLSDDQQFFSLFNRSAELIAKSAQEFQASLDDPIHAVNHTRTIKEIEHLGDEVTRNTLGLLHKTFITPFDRNDIHELISRMDDVIDVLEEASQRLHLYEIKKANDEIRGLVDIIVNSTECLKRVVPRLKDLRKTDDIIKDCDAIHRYENEADEILRSGVAKLFHSENDVRNLIKFKEIYELLETVTDRCEDVANIIEGIILEYA